jgi:hypothetical protein
MAFKKIKKIWHNFWYSPTYLDKKEAIEEIEEMIWRTKNLLVESISDDRPDEADKVLKAFSVFVKSQMKIVEKGLNWK